LDLSYSAQAENSLLQESVEKFSRHDHDVNLMCGGEMFAVT